MYCIILHYVIYISAGLSPLGVGGNTPTSQKFAHSYCTGNNFFPH